MKMAINKTDISPGDEPGLFLLGASFVYLK
jgi:hypothetical protein